MKKRKVLDRKRLPARLPLFQSIVCWLALKHWNAPEWLYGVLGVVFLIYWIASIYAFYTQKEVDFVVKEKEPEIDKEDK
jgi:hypothetical protein